MQLNPTFAILSDELSPEVFFTLIKFRGKKKLFLVNTVNFNNSRSSRFQKRKKLFQSLIRDLEIIELPELGLEISDADIYRTTNQVLLDYLDSTEFSEYIEKIISSQVLENYSYNYHLVLST